MTKHSPAKLVRSALWFAPIVIVPVAFFASLPWLREQNDAVSLGIAAVFSIFLMGYSVLLAARARRRLDEVEIAGQRFAQTKGMTIGWVAAGLVMVFPPAMTALVDLASTIGAGSPNRAIKIGVVFGVMLVIFLQALSMASASIWWGRRIGGRA
jgi:tetrahydromethanopterin S-methyltransferase subunit F